MFLDAVKSFSGLNP